jgi:predicted GNAT family acetyltransferase
MSTLAVTDNPAKSRYEATIDGTLAGYAEYEPHGPDIAFTHTETLSGFEGHGVGGALAQYGMDDVIAKGKQIVAQCPFIASYIQKHQTYLEHVPARYRG